MLFMVIEHFRGGDPAPAYERLEARGRMIPEGVRYLDSWVEAGGGRCFQVMECEREEQMKPWIDAWSDLVDFEVVPVVESATAAKTFRR